MLDTLTESLRAALPLYGPTLLALTTFLSCLALPVPASLLMLTAGAFIASGDLSGPACLASAYAGALMGDQLGYALGRGLGHAIVPRLPARTRAAAEENLDRSGLWAIFLSRWLASPLGPYINFTAGALRFSHARFSLGSLMGEAIWVSLYLGLGLAFGANLDAAYQLASSGLGLIAALVLALWLGRKLWRAVQARRQMGTEPRLAPPSQTPPAAP